MQIIHVYPRPTRSKDHTSHIYAELEKAFAAHYILAYCLARGRDPEPLTRDRYDFPISAPWEGTSLLPAVLAGRPFVLVPWTVFHIRGDDRGGNALTPDLRTE